MAVENLQEKLAKIVAKEPSKWLEDAKWRAENRAWLNRSFAIALKVLTRIDELNITQKELAERMGVSPQQVNKLVRGKENLTLETISKLEKALDMKLVEVVGEKKEVMPYTTKISTPVTYQKALCWSSIELKENTITSVYRIKLDQTSRFNKKELVYEG